MQWHVLYSSLYALLITIPFRVHLWKVDILMYNSTNRLLKATPMPVKYYMYPFLWKTGKRLQLHFATQESDSYICDWLCIITISTATFKLFVDNAIVSCGTSSQKWLPFITQLNGIAYSWFVYDQESRIHDCVCVLYMW